MKPFPDYTLLIVDDEKDLRDAISFDFQRKGFRVLTASDGHAGFEVVKNNKVDLVLSDVRMPGGDGVELLNRIKDRDVSLPVMMFITGFTDMPPDEAYDHGADAIFSKPFDRKQLFEAVVKALKPAEERLSRVDFRFELDSPVGLKFLQSKISLHSKVLNIGRGGMFVTLESQFPVEREGVEFRMDLPINPPVMVFGRGTVRWVRWQETPEKLPLGCGIEFECLESESIREFLKLMKRLPTRSFIPRK